MALSSEDGHGTHVLDGAERAAASALRELPEALILVFDRDMRFVLAAGQAMERLGHPLTCSEGQAVSNAFPPELWARIEPLFRSALAGETRSRELWTSKERHCLMVDVGPLAPAAGRGSENGNASSASGGGIAVVLDITARRQAEVLARQPLGGFEEVFERAPIGTGLLDRDGRWLLVNRALCEITGYTSDELIGKSFDGIMHPEDVGNDSDQRTALERGEIPAVQVEKRYFDASGEIVTALVSMSLVRDQDGRPVHYITQLQDISERKQLEAHLRHLADHDPLTGLRNRRLFEHDLRMQVARSQRYGEVAGLMLIELDQFALIEEDLGATVSDQTLKAVARALTRRLRETDLVARLGGGRFAVMLPHIDEEGMQVVAEGLVRVIPACSVEAGDGVVHPYAEIGFALIDESAESAQQVLSEADRALYALDHEDLHS